jgi:hypothetical protein
MAQVKVKFNRGVEGATNIVDAGTEGTKVATGTTAQRGSTTGQIRFNSTTGLAEYYTGTDFKSIDSPPTISSISPTTATAGNTSITITGSNFQTGATVKFIGNDGTEYASPSVTVNSSTQITATTPASALTVANEPYDVQVTNSSNLSGIKADALDAGSTPAFGIASGSLGTLNEGDSASGFTQITATDADGQSITISLKSGSSLPSGVTLNSDGTFSGTVPTTGSDVTTTFTVEATDGVNTAERQYSITAKVPIYVQLSGSGTWSIPSGITSAEILIVAGGASGSRSANVAGGGGGAGGVVHTSSYTFTSTDISSGIAYSIGAGGNGVGISPEGYDGGYNNGGDTTFAISGGTITAKGGGGGAGYGGQTNKPGFSASYYTASQGGSGGGGAWEYETGASSNQGTFSGWTSYGNSGGTFNESGGGANNGAGGGGAGASGGGATRSLAGVGGAGQLFSSFTAYGENGYFGGGGAGGDDANSSARSGGVGGGGNGGHTGNRNGVNATDTTGGGGGGSSSDGYSNFTYKSGDGGNGTILIKY